MPAVSSANWDLVRSPDFELPGEMRDGMVVGVWGGITEGSLSDRMKRRRESGNDIVLLLGSGEGRRLKTAEVSSFNWWPLLELLSGWSGWTVLYIVSGEGERSRTAESLSSERRIVPVRSGESSRGAVRRVRSNGRERLNVEDFSLPDFLLSKMRAWGGGRSYEGKV